MSHGTITVGDVVAYELDGSCRLGELLMTVGLSSGANAEMISIVSVWEHDSEPAEFLSCRAVHGKAAKIKTNMLIESVAYHMSADSTSCTVCLPYILRKRMLAV